jgi:hypothetical protein
VERPHPASQEPRTAKAILQRQKKRHSIKNNLIIERRTRKIKGLSTTCEGKKHDKKLADEQAPPFSQRLKALEAYRLAGL